MVLVIITMFTYICSDVISNARDCTILMTYNCDRDVDEIRYQLALSLVRMNRLVRFYSEGTRLFHIRIVWRAINYYASIKRLCNLYSDYYVMLILIFIVSVVLRIVPSLS